MSRAVAGDASAAGLQAAVRARFEAATDAPAAFFAARSGDLARACLDLATTFHQGNRLLVAGTGAAASDALHVSVEFVHPVIVGKRALPAIALTDAPADWIRATAEPGDMVMALSAGAGARDREAARAALAAARAGGCRTIALAGVAPGGTGAPTREPWQADHILVVDAPDPLVAQEVQETAYHVLWELVHVFLDHPEMLG